jgi:hypothetical protein
MVLQRKSGVVIDRAHHCAWIACRSNKRLLVLTATASDLVSRGLPRGNVMLLTHAVNLAWCRPTVDPELVDRLVDDLMRTP